MDMVSRKSHSAKASKPCGCGAEIASQLSLALNVRGNREQTDKEKLKEFSRRAVNSYQSARQGDEISYGLLPAVY